MKITMLAAVFVLLIQWNVRKRDQASAMPLLVKALAIISLLLWIGVLCGAPHTMMKNNEKACRRLRENGFPIWF